MVIRDSNAIFIFKWFFTIHKKNNEIKVTIKVTTERYSKKDNDFTLGILTVKLNKDTLIPFSNNSIIRYFINKDNKLDIGLLLHSTQFIKYITAANIKYFFTYRGVYRRYWNRKAWVE